ncbi:hypothetical protein MSAN_01874600 [Mycena sanguinolenta]|uniref:G-patch domain-containing protein n=1 Tax=Mycena sanguinolenta TaxID=230812 RepID=A0A8H7CSG5_9AGAR|nr:hypothetical protein MSAN_01874600 [Mycena sanguinolenta]
MPLDGHSYLVSQGWTGSGTGLRQGAIARPLAIPQKKTLAGLGKDRDEAFPFWDHLFSAASKSIQIKISGDSDDSDSEPSANVSLKRTTTGILSNRRPVTGALADDSGATTPEVIDDTIPQLSLLATAKRAAAKRMLYSRFFRGPILGPDSAFPPEPAVVDVPVVAPPTDEKKELKEKKRAEKSREKNRAKEKEKERESIDAVTTTSDPEIKEKKRKRKREAEEGMTSSSDPELKGKKRKRKREAEDDKVEVKGESKRKSKQKSEKDPKADKEKRKKEKRERKETSQESGEERKRKRPIE